MNYHSLNNKNLHKKILLFKYYEFLYPCAVNLIHLLIHNLNFELIKIYLPSLITFIAIMIS